MSILKLTVLAGVRFIQYTSEDMAANCYVELLRFGSVAGGISFQ